MTPARVIYALALATLLALALVRQSAELRKVGYRLEQLRTEISGQRAEQAILRAHLSKLKSPRRVVGLVRWLGLELCERPPTQAAEQSIAQERTLAPQTGGEVSVAAAP